MQPFNRVAENDRLLSRGLMTTISELALQVTVPFQAVLWFTKTMVHE